MVLLRTSQCIPHSCPHLSACGLLLSGAIFSASTQHASDHQTLGSHREPSSLRLLPKGSLPGFCPRGLKVLLLMALCLPVPSLLCHGFQFPSENCKDLGCSMLSPPTYSLRCNGVVGPCKTAELRWGWLSGGQLAYCVSQRSMLHLQDHTYTGVLERRPFQSLASTWPVVFLWLLGKIHLVAVTRSLALETCSPSLSPVA